MELGSWSLISAPSLLALIPLVVMIVLIFIGKSNVSGIMVGILVGALMMGQDLGMMASAFATSLGSSTALIGLIIMMGAGLGVLMSEAGVTHTLVYWIVKRIGVNTQTKGKIALVVVSIIVCGLLALLPIIVNMKYGADDFVVSLLFNYVIFYVGNYIFSNFLMDINSTSSGSYLLPEDTFFPTLVEKTKINGSLIVALVMVVFTWFFLYFNNFKGR